MINEFEKIEQEVTVNSPMKLALEQGKKIQEQFTLWGRIKAWFTK